MSRRWQNETRLWPQSASRGASSPLADGERANFFNINRAAPLECLAARFRRHVYAPHTHESYVVGTIVAGCETFLIGGCRYYAGRGDICFINPDVVHDGEPAGDGYAYRIAYPTIEYLRDVMIDAAERRATGTPCSSTPIIRDPALARSFAAVHRLAETTGGSLETDELLLRSFLHLLIRHADADTRVRSVLDRPAPTESAAVTRALDYLDAHYSEAIDLATLAGIAGMPRTRLIRAVKRATGLTPHAWLTDRRIRAARVLLHQGMAPADVGVACGLYDQSHLNRVFKARVGVSPGMYQAAHDSHRRTFIQANP